MPYTKVRIDRDIYSITKTRFLVAAGVTGIIVSRDRGYVGVLCDEGTGFCLLSGCNQRLQDVPFLYVTEIGRVDA